jgi:hypothetical protein
MTTTAHPSPLRSLPLSTPTPQRRSHPHRGRLRPWALFVAIVVLAFFGLTYSRISLDRSAFVLETLDEQIAVEEAAHFDLRVQVAELRDPQRIAAAAADLGMVFPGRRVDLAVEPVGGADLDPEYRWAQLRALLGAQP